MILLCLFFPMVYHDPFDSALKKDWSGSLSKFQYFHWVLGGRRRLNKYETPKPKTQSVFGPLSMMPPTKTPSWSCNVLRKSTATTMFSTAYFELNMATHLSISGTRYEVGPSFDLPSKIVQNLLKIGQNLLKTCSKLFQSVHLPMKLPP